MKSKVKDLNELKKISYKLKSKKKKIVLCHGDFDFLHLGHIKHLKAAKAFGDVLFVSITNDKFIEKGLGRPLYSSTDRSEFLSAIEFIDYVYIDNNVDASKIISVLKPNFYVKGSDYKKVENDLSKNIVKERKITEKFGGKLYFTNERTFSSSSIINSQQLHTDISKKIREVKKKFTKNKILEYFKNIKKQKILVIGDTIIDEYIYVSALGKPSKENIIASLYQDKELFLGGVFASVANLSSFSNKIDLITSIGNNKKDFSFIKKNMPQNINSCHILKNNNLTTKKTRFVDRSHENIRKLYEYYSMHDEPISKSTEKKILNILKKNIKKYDLVIVNDYGHGLMTNKIISFITKKSKYYTVNAQINAGNRGYNLITRYKNANYYCLDLNEARMAVGDKYMPEKQIPIKLLKLCGGKNISLTMGSRGSISTNRAKHIISFPPFTRSVIDTISAGDAYYSFSTIIFFSPNLYYFRLL